MHAVAVIPARYDSTRFPGKPLACRTGKYLVQHVYERVRQCGSIEQVVIATDDERIAAACRQFGASWAMTRSDHPSGTDRVAEVAAQLDADVIVNVQGDEPEIDPGSIDRAVAALAEDPEASLSTLMARFGPADDAANPNIVKVVCDQRGRALYFSRSAIPYGRDPQATPAYAKHIGLYAYRREALARLSGWPPTPLEQLEKLEQLRALEHGLVIAVRGVEHHAVGIDTPEQYQAFVARHEARRPVASLQPETTAARPDDIDRAAPA